MDCKGLIAKTSGGLGARPLIQVENYANQSYRPNMSTLWNFKYCSSGRKIHNLNFQDIFPWDHLFDTDPDSLTLLKF
jgi:hypothetical protein